MENEEELLHEIYVKFYFYLGYVFVYLCHQADYVKVLQ